MSEGRTEERKRRGAMATGIILTGIGLQFLLIYMRLLPPIGRSWPLILIIIGLALVAEAFMRTDAGASTAAKPRAADQTSPPPPP